MRRVALTVIWGALALFLTAGIASATTVYGTFADEYIYGTSGNDFISAGPGADAIFGYEGDDVIYAADGLYPEYSNVDEISCGDGIDIAIVDANDVVSSDCETAEFDQTVYPA